MAPSTPVHGNWIAGKHVASRSNRTFENRNPADVTELIGRFADSDERDVRDAVDAAADAYKSWRLVPGPQRGEILYRLGEILRDRKEQYARDMTREMGKVLKEARGDVQEAIDMAFLMGGEGRRLHGQTTPSELPNKFAMSVRSPIGVCAFITPWNFPMAIPAWKSTAALVCGNTIVIKPATDTPLSVVNFAKALEDAGLPPGVFNVVTGSGSKVGNPLLKDPRVKVVSFTGSTSVGRAINEACAPSFKHVHLEMGGKNPIIVLDDANLELAVDGAIWGAFGTSGQRCTASSRLLVHRKVVEEVHRDARRARCGAQGRQRTRREERDGPGDQREPARHGSRLHLDRQGRGREGRRGRQASHRQGPRQGLVRRPHRFRATATGR